MTEPVEAPESDDLEVRIGALRQEMQEAPDVEARQRLGQQLRNLLDRRMHRVSQAGSAPPRGWAG